MGKLAELGKYGVPLVALALIAAALFLPAHLSQWQDQQILDEPHITAQEAREGFAESVQPTVGEKLLLMRTLLQNGSNSMWLEAGFVEGLFVCKVNEEGVAERTIEHGHYFYDSAEIPSAAVGLESAKYFTEENSHQEMEESLALWDQRLTAVWGEIRSLQSMGGLPELWGEEFELEYNGSGETLYMDPDTGVSFRVFQMSLSGHPYTLNMTVDVQTGRIFSFTLQWGKGYYPSWGFRGPVNFGSAWRDYWGMDSVSSTWYSEYIRQILESSEESLRLNGDYNSNGQISFVYDGQSLPVTLSNWSGSRGGSLIWG